MQGSMDIRYLKVHVLCPCFAVDKILFNMGSCEALNQILNDLKFFKWMMGMNGQCNLGYSSPFIPILLFYRSQLVKYIVSVMRRQSISKNVLYLCNVLVRKSFRKIMRDGRRGVSNADDAKFARSAIFMKCVRYLDKTGTKSLCPVK